MLCCTRLAGRFVRRHSNSIVSCSAGSTKYIATQCTALQSNTSSTSRDFTPIPSFLHSKYLQSSSGNHERTFVLPGCVRPAIIYSFPNLSTQSAIVEPSIVRHAYIEPVISSVTSIGEYRAPAHTVIEKHAIRMFRVRHRKMIRHHRYKRHKRDRVKYLKAQAVRKANAEMAFRTRVQTIVDEANTFDAEVYVRDVLQRVDAIERQRATGELKVGKDGKPVTIYKHWTTVMTVDELYGIPYSDYIDKRTGYPSGEDWKAIKADRDDYYNNYSNVDDKKAKKNVNKKTDKKEN